MRIVILLYMIALFILHQDFWLKDDASLLFGFLPSSLAYHMVFTVLAAFGWFMVVKFAWPKFAEEQGEASEEAAKQ